MGIEIERKYLLDIDQWNALPKPPGQYLRQGYLSTDPTKTIRVRVTDTNGWITIKGLSVGAARAEFEYGIPQQEATELLDMFAVAGLTKIRYKINYKGMLWEVDEFLADNLGLIVAEIELKDELQLFDIPDWISREVTGEEKYYNSNLSIHPYNKW
jgi:CYTH domain-containing protein